MNHLRLALLSLFLVLPGTVVLALDGSQKEIIIGSKNFTENIILAEIATQLTGITSIPVSHQSGLGGSRILWSAIKVGDIVAYPEYTGTLKREIFSHKSC